MARYSNFSRLEFGCAWLALCVLAWWCGRADFFSGAKAVTLTLGSDNAAAAPVLADETSATVAENVITQALEEIRRLSAGEWAAGSELANFLRQGGKYRFAESLPVSVLRAVIERLAHDPAEGSAFLAFDLAHTVLLERHPRSAFEAMSAIVAKGHSNIPYDQAFVCWRYAKNEPQEALAYWVAEYQKTPRPEWLKPEQLRLMFDSYGFHNFDTALRAAEELPGSELQKAALTGLQGAMASFFPKDTTAWRVDAEARELTQKIIAAAGEEARLGLNAALSARMRSEDPAATLAWYESLALAPENCGWASKALADAWAEKAPADAWTWYVAQAAPEQKSEALERAVRKWTETEAHFRDPLEPDLAACSEWLIGQGLGEASQQAMSTLARAYAKQYEPEAALAWARAIPSEEIRQTAEREVATEIKKRFPSQWQQWLPEPR